MDPNNGSHGGGDRTIPTRGFAPPRGYALSGKIMLITIVLLFGVVILIVLLHLYIRWRHLRLSSRRRRARRLVFAVEVHGPAAAAAASRGLDPVTLESLPVHVYTAVNKESKGGVAAECAVCLNEFDEGEKVRGLPRCGHRFHIECIDMWFQSHATCPLCRSPVEPARPPAAAVDGSAQVNLCSDCEGVGVIVGTSSSAAGVSEMRVDVPARSGWEDEGVSTPGGLKSPGGRIRAIRRMLSRDLSLYRGGGVSAEEQGGDLERGEGTARAPPPPTTI